MKEEQLKAISIRYSPPKIFWRVVIDVCEEPSIAEIKVVEETENQVRYLDENSEEGKARKKTLTALIVSDPAIASAVVGSLIDEIDMKIDQLAVCKAQIKSFKIQ